MNHELERDYNLSDSTLISSYFKSQLSSKTFSPHSAKCNKIESNTCNLTPFFLRSVLACWEKTMQLQDLIAKSGSVVTGACADVDGKTDKKELGKYLMDGFINLR